MVLQFTQHGTLARMADAVSLGTVECPSGELLILDPGLGRFWRHDGDPRSPRRSDPEDVDLAIEGRDAAAAAPPIVFDPRFVFDVARGSLESFRSRVEARIARDGLDARLRLLEARITHLERARLALKAREPGLGAVSFNHNLGVVVSGLPTRALPVVGVPMPEGDFGKRWRSIDVVIDADATVARTQRLGDLWGVTVEHGQLLFVGLEPMGAFRMWQPEDGLADYITWGQDAEQVSQPLGALDLGDGRWGWLDVPMARVGEIATPLQARVMAEKLRVGIDYRPHCNLERLNSQIRSSALRAGTLTLDGCAATGCDNRWGDGVFEVAKDFDAAGNVVRVRVELGTEVTQALLREVAGRAKRTG